MKLQQVREEGWFKKQFEGHSLVFVALPSNSRTSLKVKVNSQGVIIPSDFCTDSMPGFIRVPSGVCVWGTLLLSVA